MTISNVYFQLAKLLVFVVLGISWPSNSTLYYNTPADIIYRFSGVVGSFGQHVTSGSDYHPID